MYVCVRAVFVRAHVCVYVRARVCVCVHVCACGVSIGCVTHLVCWRSMCACDLLLLALTAG